MPMEPLGPLEPSDSRAVEDAVEDIVWTNGEEAGTLPRMEDLPYEDGIPLETNWHREQMNLLIETLCLHWHDRPDFFAGGNMFIYYSPNRLKTEDVHGPDFFVVKGVRQDRQRLSWVVWEEQNRTPDLIMELVSASTRREDEGRKKERYQTMLRTPEYILYYPDKQRLVGWKLVGGTYQPMAKDARGWLWSNELELWLGTWQGFSKNAEYNTWVRLFDADNRMLLTGIEIAAIEADARSRAEALARTEADGRSRAETRLREMEAEIRRLKGEG